MQVKKGQDRIVILFPWIGIAVKFPIVHFWRVVCLLCYDIKRGNWDCLKKNWEWPIEARSGFKGLLFRGLATNWGEFRFYRSTHNPFLQPTYLSFGFVNIQRYDEPCKLKNVDLWCQLYELTNGDVFADSHHFENPRNFCFNNGMLRILDYGSRRSQGVISKHGARIVEVFNSAYDWEEEKAKLKVKNREVTN